jgi:hypothetical protein
MLLNCAPINDEKNFPIVITSHQNVVQSFELI